EALGCLGSRCSPGWEVREPMSSPVSFSRLDDPSGLTLYPTMYNINIEVAPVRLRLNDTKSNLGGALGSVTDQNVIS
ncbi:hypothetical protein CH063_01103, partial [Colletotrichum higginsianum]